MFRMTIEDSKKLHSNLIAVIGPCVNIRKFTSPLEDDLGNIYEAHIPMEKTLVFNDSRVILGIYGKYDAESLKGRTLTSIQN